VFKLSDEIAVVQTVDFLTPIVDDPFIFGKIAAANALSDVYAMGGKPITALNIVAFPQKKYDTSVLQEILKGGLEAVLSTGAVLAGGHSIDDAEIKYGLSVTGTVHPKKVIENHGVKNGDVLVLTKALGTGIISSAVKKGNLPGEVIEAHQKSMMEINMVAAEVMLDFEINACTDITGFGLAGHLCEMISDDSLTVKMNSSEVPLLPGAREYAKEGFIPGGAFRNRDFCKTKMVGLEKIDRDLADIFHDPQTSGGLLIALSEKSSKDLVSRLKDKGIMASIIGSASASNKTASNIEWL